ncbi:uncharacterized protein BJ212DRAFT_1475623 [Suillus subaureus]|uniref:Uncharacterized protein n=1 Tax=Suillus subaureus TaxID=48587 RepID=A0A9P7ENN5_9AGAM|nr:uncharacterized protein BJ212DRAFT_1475623 [Suillus subaureus]KAG1826291.1 hypothetical protein BJ212DRAFT_1475623 [Suillus subaureus]
MSLKDIGKYDVSEEAQALKDKLASQDTENAGLRSHLMKREAELEEIKTSLNETLYKLSAEADRALRLESDLARRSDELKIEKVASRNGEAALLAAQDRLKAEERTARELEATLDTMSCQSESIRAQTFKLEIEKRNMESRVRELERMLENTKPQPTATSRLPQRGGRPRSSSVSSFRSPALEQELNDTKILLADKEKVLRDMETKLARAREDLVKTQNTQFSAEKIMQARIAELRSVIEDKDEELEVLKSSQGPGNAMEREEELLKRIDEDEVKIETLESLLREQQSGPTQAAYDKLQRKLRAESEKLTCSEKRVRDLMEEKKEAQDACANLHQELDRANRLLHDSEKRVRALMVTESGLQQELMDLRCDKESTATDQDHMDIDVEDIRSNFDSSFLYPNCSTPLPPINTNGSAHPDEATLANYIETLLRAVDRIRSERDDLRRALEFSETEAQITVQTLEKRIHTLTQEADEVSAYNQQSKRLVLFVTALGVVVDHLRSRLHAAEQNQVLDHSQLVAERDATLRDLQNKFEVSCQQLTASAESHSHLLLLVTELEVKVQSLTVEVQAAESSHEDTRNGLQQTEERLAELTRAYQNIESERNSLSLQVTNLQTDLEVAQEELTDAHNRYSTLQAQQLSTMSATGVAHALREQIQELEGRVNRRTEQIGVHQHDIRRLETNLKLQEERISEMMSELEMMSAQKEAMVEDCAEARDARDQAVTSLEAAELEVEKLQEENVSLKATHSDELSSMVAIVAQATSNARRAQLMVDQHLAEEPQMLSKIAVLTAQNLEFSEDIRVLAGEKEVLIQNLTESVASLSCLEALRSQERTEMDQLVVSLATVREALSSSDCSLEKSRQNVAALQAQLTSCRCALEDKVATLELRDARLAILEQNLAEISNESAAASTRRISEYQGQLQSLQDELDELRTRYQITCESLSRAQDDLQERIQEPQASESNAELQDLHARYAVEVRDLRERLEHTSQELSQATQLLQSADLRFAEVQERNRELNDQIAALTDDNQRRTVTEESLRVRHVEELDILQKTLSNTQNELAVAKEECQRLANLVEQSTNELELARQAHMDALREAEQQVRELQDDQEQKDAALKANETDLQDLRISLDERSREQDLLHTQLQNEVACRKQDQAAFNDQLSSHADHQVKFDALKAELQQVNEATRWRLEQAEAELSSLQAEKQSLQVETTSLEAEIQRSMSLTRFLEQQVRESEITNSSLKETLEQIQLRLAQSEKAGKTAELSLALQTTQHEKAMSSLRWELDAVRSEPKLRDVVAELKEKNREMDQLLQSKCSEIEDYDDRILEALKANKKLSTKVEALTRKVQNLQSKLASTKESAQTPPVNLAAPSVQTGPPIVPPVPRVSIFTDTKPILGRDRTMSNTSAASRSQTPERKPMQPSMMQTGIPEEEVPTSAGKKRRAPDCDDRETVPPEGRYTSDSDMQAATTPRLRKTLHSSRSGFTPVRSARNIASLPSPGKRVTTTISDVTNSPRSTSDPQTSRNSSKRTWLGKIRGGVPQSNNPGGRVVSSRANVFEKMPNVPRSS